jgi:hypothetical protein
MTLIDPAYNVGGFPCGIAALALSGVLIVAGYLVITKVAQIDV